MELVSLLSPLLVLGLPNVHLSLLDGSERSGMLRALTDRHVVVTGSDGETAVELSRLVEIRFDGPADEFVAGPRVYLTDGTTLALREIRIASQQATIETLSAGPVLLPLAAVQAVRLNGAAPELDSDWEMLRVRTTRRDLVILPKKSGDGLQFTRGVLGAVGGKTVSFVLGGDSIKIDSERLFGIVYARTGKTADAPFCALRLANGDRISAQSVEMTDGSLRLRLSTGTGVSIPLEQIVVADFSAGKIVYLSDVDPIHFDYRSFIPLLDPESEKAMFRFRRNATMDGRALRLGGRTWERGLWIHSRSELVYRLDGDYRRFRALMGIDDDRTRARPGRGDVQVVISGDGRALFERNVRWSHEPVPLDLDVTGVRELEILVDFGSEGDISDWLDLVNARVVK